MYIMHVYQKDVGVYIYIMNHILYEGRVPECPLCIDSWYCAVVEGSDGTVVAGPGTAVTLVGILNKGVRGELRSVFNSQQVGSSSCSN